MGLDVGREGPRHHRSSLHGWQGGGDSKRPSLERALTESGLDLKILAEVFRKRPEIIVTIRRQLDELAKNGATSQDIAEYFRQQAELSQSIANSAGKGGWKQILEQLKKDLPKAN